jgi:flagella basal body P-ring formation protein FlgA
MNSRAPLPALLFALALPAAAQSPATAIDAVAAQRAEASAAVRDFVQGELARTQPQLRAEINVGEMDARLHLAPCEHAEAYLRSGARLWGRSFVGYRCLQRPGWSVSIPVEVRLYGPAVVALQAVPALQPIPAADVQVREVELTQEPGGVVRDPAELEGRICARALEAGQPVPLNALRTLPAVAQGEPVKVVGTGSGFSITTEGTALATAAPGEMVRVRLESGRTIAGLARKGRLVEVTF